MINPNLPINPKLFPIFAETNRLNHEKIHSPRRSDTAARILLLAAARHVTHPFRPLPRALRHNRRRRHHLPFHTPQPRRHGSMHHRLRRTRRITHGSRPRRQTRRRSPRPRQHRRLHQHRRQLRRTHRPLRQPHRPGPLHPQ